MGKFNLALILLFEALFTAAISLVAGLLGGMRSRRSPRSGFSRLIGADFTYKLTVSPSALVFTVTIYLIIFGLILLRSVSRVGFAKRRRPDKERKRRREAAEWRTLPRYRRSLSSSASAYWLAVTIKDPVAALTLFFVAVLMVIAATYMIFISGSVVFCRLLQKNKGYYYQQAAFCLGLVDGLQNEAKRRGAGVNLHPRDDGARHDLVDDLPVLWRSRTPCARSTREKSTPPRISKALTT